MAARDLSASSPCVVPFGAWHGRGATSRPSRAPIGDGSALPSDPDGPTLPGAQVGENGPTPAVRRVGIGSPWRTRRMADDTGRASKRTSPGDQHHRCVRHAPIHAVVTRPTAAEAAARASSDTDVAPVR